MSHSPLKVAINAQMFAERGVGGIETVLVGLVRALGALDGPEEYVLICPWENADWLRPHMGPNQTAIRGPKLEFAKRFAAPLRPAVNKLRHKVNRTTGRYMWPIVRNSDGFYEQSGCAVIYFPTPQFIRCDIPSVYTIHDLQHVYYPEFFSNDDLSWKEATFRAGCEHADTIVAISNRVKEDIVTSYGTDPNRIEVIYWGPPTQAHAAPENSTSEALLKEYSVRSPYVLFPSMTRIHKNHIRLLEATAKVRDESGLVMQLVCTGHQTDFWPKIKEKLVSLRLEHQVKFLGMVHSVDLRAFYRLAEFVIFPSLFEGAGMPVLEAWQDNAPVACSDVTSLPELAGDAAFLFDPTSVSSIADALVRMHTDTALREGLRRRGSERLQHFSWMKTAKHYRAVFRRAARNPLNEEDRWLLSHPPLGVSSCS